jgi:hypothetical protein
MDSRVTQHAVESRTNDDHSLVPADKSSFSRKRGFQQRSWSSIFDLSLLKSSRMDSRFRGTDVKIGTCSDLPWPYPPRGGLGGDGVASLVIPAEAGIHFKPVTATTRCAL